MTKLVDTIRAVIGFSVVLVAIGVALSWFAILPTLGLLYLRAMP